MTRRLTTLLLLAGLALLQASPEDAAAPAATDQTAPSYDMKAQSLLDLENVQKKFVDLANALPADKFTWRPVAGTRSFAETFLHIAAERYAFLGNVGADRPAGFNGKALEKLTTERTGIVDELNKSWEFTRNAISHMTNADFAKLLPKFGPQANEGDVVYLLVADQHEHLGQLIAYSRQNGIVPPWTAAAKQIADKKAQQK